MSKIDIATYNVRGLANLKKRREIFHYLNKKYENIIYLQETHSVKKCECRWRSEWGGCIYYAHGSHNARGVAILTKKNTNIKIKHQDIDPSGRFLILKAIINKQEVLLVNIYAPNNDNPILFHDLFETIENYNVPIKIIAGDFNLASIYKWTNKEV